MTQPPVSLAEPMTALSQATAGQTIPLTYRKGAISGVLVADVTDGQITRERTYWDQMELLGQLGLIPA